VFNIKKIFVKPKRRVSPEKFKDNLKEFIRLGNMYNFRLLFILEPHRGLGKFAEEVKSNPYYNVMYRLSRKYPEGVMLIDTVSLFNKYAGREDKIFYDEMHLTSLGHKILAGEIYNVLNKNKAFWGA